jgi:hypothetical protein
VSSAGVCGGPVGTFVVCLLLLEVGGSVCSAFWALYFGPLWTFFLLLI